MVATTTRDRPTLSGRRRLIRRLARLLTIAIVSPAIFVGWRWASGNLGEVEHNRVFRSAQLGPKAIERLVRAHGIKTVINLRGRNPEARWYRLEREATLKAGATHVDFSMASDMWLSRNQAHALMNVLKDCEYPIAIHCEWGAERTGLVSAFVSLSRPGNTIDEARGQFSPYYLFLPNAHGKTMRSHVDAYQAWLAVKHMIHSAESFRLWIAEEYRPLGPSREDWPFNPYPLVEIEKPGAPKRVVLLDSHRSNSR